MIRATLRIEVSFFDPLDHRQIVAWAMPWEPRLAARGYYSSRVRRTKAWAHCNASLFDLGLREARVSIRFKRGAE